METWHYRLVFYDATKDIVSKDFGDFIDCRRHAEACSQT